LKPSKEREKGDLGSNVSGCLDIAGRALGRWQDAGDLFDLGYFVARQSPRRRSASRLLSVTEKGSTTVYTGQVVTLGNFSSGLVAAYLPKTL